MNLKALTFIELKFKVKDVLVCLNVLVSNSFALALHLN